MTRHADMPDATVIVPFHADLGQLGRCLAAIRRSSAAVEIIVAADGAEEDPHRVAAAAGARVVVVPGPAGPAVARNRGAAIAAGRTLIFVDADVVVDAQAVPRLCAVLERDAAIAGVFGAYDMHPAEPNFMSQYRNLSHAYIHEAARVDASTFWAGLGAVRAAAFWSVGGFDERFARPSVEDIDLGYRLTAAGYSIRVDPRVRGTHLKRWTVWSATITDVVRRGVPWTQLMLRDGAMRRDLNTTLALRVSVVLAWLLVIAVAVSIRFPQAAVAVVGLLTVLFAVNRRYYAWFAAQRSWRFTCTVYAAHTWHHLCNGLSYVVGTALYAAQRVGIALPGALPRDAWRSPAASRDLAP